MKRPKPEFVTSMNLASGSELHFHPEKTMFRLRRSNNPQSVAKINMIISIDDISSKHKARDGMSEITALQYKKLVDPNAAYIGQVAHYPSYPGSELIHGGYAGVTQVIVVNGTKKRVLLADTHEPMNVGMEQNPAIQVIEADAVYLITQSNRTFSMGKIEDFAGMTQYAIVDNIFKNTNAVAEK